MSLKVSQSLWIIERKKHCNFFHISFCDIVTIEVITLGPLSTINLTLNPVK